MKKRIIIAALLATTGGIAVLADPMTEAIHHGGYNANEDRFFVPAVMNLADPKVLTGEPVYLVEKKDFDAFKKRVEKLEEDHKKNPAKHGCVSLIEGLTLENRQDRLEQRIKDLEKEVFGGPPKRYGF